MASPFALSVIAWISAVFIPGPVRGSAPEAKPSASEASAGSTAIINVTVIDILTGTHRTGVTVLIHADRIAAIAPSVSLPPEAMRVDGTGKFLIPGLWDMHTQHQGTGADCLIYL